MVFGVRDAYNVLRVVELLGCFWINVLIQPYLVFADKLSDLVQGESDLRISVDDVASVIPVDCDNGTKSKLIDFITNGFFVFAVEFLKYTYQYKRFLDFSLITTIHL